MKDQRIINLIKKPDEKEELKQQKSTHNENLQ